MVLRLVGERLAILNQTASRNEFDRVKADFPGRVNNIKVRL